MADQEEAEAPADAPAAEEAAPPPAETPAEAAPQTEEGGKGDETTETEGEQTETETVTVGVVTSTIAEIEGEGEEAYSIRAREEVLGEDYRHVHFEFTGEGDLMLMPSGFLHDESEKAEEEELYGEMYGVCEEEMEILTRPSDEELRKEEVTVQELEVEEEEELIEYHPSIERLMPKIEEMPEDKAKGPERVIMKTPSELLLDQEERRRIEEGMRKLLAEPRKKPGEERQTPPTKPVETEKLSISEVELEGLYKKPETVESAISFISEDELDEMKKRSSIMGIIKLRDQQRQVNSIMRRLSESMQGFPNSIFALQDEEAIAELQKYVEEAVKEEIEEEDIKEYINEKLKDYNKVLREAVLASLEEHIRERELEEVEQAKLEEAVVKEKGTEEVVKKKMALTRKEEAGITKIQETMLELGKEMPREILEEELGEQIEAESIEGEGYLEMIPIPPPELEKPVEVMPYEKTDWCALLTPSERKLPLDPEFRREMEEFIQKHKAELIEKMRIEEERRRLEELYRSEDPDIKFANINITITIKFVINTGDIFTCSYRFFMTIWEVKEDLAGIFRIPPDVILIYDLEGTEIKDELLVKDLGIEPFQSTKLRLLTLDSDKFPLESWHLELPVPDILTVTVETGKDHHDIPEYKEIVVEIIDRKIRKPFVGGYRDPETGKEYHHAFSQSAPHKPYLPVEKRNHRDTQTHFWRKQKMDTVCNKATQMWRRDCFISTEHDKILTARPYIDYEQSEKNKNLEGKVRTIQRYLRAYIIRKYARRMSEEYKRRKEWEEEQERKRLAEREQRIRDDIINMSFPKTKADFDMLYAMVERWRKAQVERITQLKTEAPRKAEFCALLEKEIKLLESIEVHRINVLNEQRRRRNLKFMEKVSKPVQWTGYRGMTISMDTIRTQRAREMKELYQRLSRDDLNYKQRIELLMSLKYALKIHNTRLTIEIQDLINRECDLLIRGVKSSQLDYLRRRTEALFMQFFREADFNPEVAKYLPEYNKDPYRNNNIVFCKLCSKMKMKDRFCVKARDFDINTCCTCKWVNNIAVPRVDYNPYRYILRNVRRDEQKRNCYSSTAFILTEEDTYFLVQNIWHAISAISGDDNLYDLRLPRWDITQDWTPWNCILVTDVEMKAHLKVKLNTYEPEFVKRIHNYHLLAKNQFKQLMASDQRIRDSGVWANVVDEKKYIAPPKTADIIFDDGLEDVSNYKKCKKIKKPEKPKPERDPLCDFLYK